MDFQKVDDSIKMLKQGEHLALSLNPRDGNFLAFSGGKDSLVLLRLAEMAGVRFKAVHSVTGIDAPETMYYIQDNFPDVELQHTKWNYFQLVERYGLPTMKKRFCCQRLKERVGAGNVVLTGVRAQESLKRASYAEIEIFSRRKEHQGKDRGRTLEQLEANEHQCIKGKDRVMMRPILGWTDDDVWGFINWQGLKVNPSYKNAGRVGCMFCPFASKEQIEKYERLYPLYHKRVLLAVERYWERCKEHQLSGPKEYYEWWKSKTSLEKWKKLHA